MFSDLAGHMPCWQGYLYYQKETLLCYGIEEQCVLKQTGFILGSLDTAMMLICLDLNGRNTIV